MVQKNIIPLLAPCLDDLEVYFEAAFLFIQLSGKR